PDYSQKDVRVLCSGAKTWHQRHIIMLSRHTCHSCHPAVHPLASPIGAVTTRPGADGSSSEATLAGPLAVDAARRLRPRPQALGIDLPSACLANAVRSRPMASQGLLDNALFDVEDAADRHIQVPLEEVWG